LTRLDAKHAPRSDAEAQPAPREPVAQAAPAAEAAPLATRPSESGGFNTDLGLAPPSMLASLGSRTSIVIAAYNEAGSIGAVVAELLPTYPNVVVVDDGSSDDTAQRAAAAGARVLRHLINRGQGAALQTGINYALTLGSDFIVTFDADGQHDAADLPALLVPLARGEAEICLGSRFMTQHERMPLTRRIVLFCAVIFTRITARAKLSDTHNGLRAFTRRAAQMLDLKLDRMAHASEILDQVVASELPYIEVPVRVRYTEYSLRKGQRSSAALRVAFDYFMGRLIR
jgi:glycosyltransferase involved in cell wall biosynthesis